jgi:hypothetical protein
MKLKVFKISTNQIFCWSIPILFLACTNSKKNEECEFDKQRVIDLELQVQELSSSLERKNEEFIESEIELSKYKSFKFIKKLNGRTTHYYDDLAKAFDDSQDEIEELESTIGDLESRLRNCN